MSIQDPEWFAACLVSESDRPSEWPFLCNVMLNRLKHPRYPDSPRGVVLQKQQFSFFNGYLTTDLERPTLEQVWKDLGANAEARRIANAVARMGNVMLLPENTLNFWSPVSMNPTGSLPDWNWNILRCFTIGTIDPFRFVFAEEVRPTHPLTGIPHEHDYTEILGGSKNGVTV